VATVDNIRNSLISKLLTVRDQDILKALDKLISASTKDSKVELSKEQFTMIEMGISDFEKGNVISQSELFEQEREWLRKK
jgi:hypothetical protein